MFKFRVDSEGRKELERLRVALLDRRSARMGVSDVVKVRSSKLPFDYHLTVSASSSKRVELGVLRDFVSRSRLFNNAKCGMSLSNIEEVADQ